MKPKPLGGSRSQTKGSIGTAEKAKLLQSGPVKPERSSLVQTVRQSSKWQQPPIHLWSPFRKATAVSRETISETRKKIERDVELFQSADPVNKTASLNRFEFLLETLRLRFSGELEIAREATREHPEISRRHHF